MSYNQGLPNMGSATGSRVDSAAKHIMACKVHTNLLGQWRSEQEQTVGTRFSIGLQMQPGKRAGQLDYKCSRAGQLDSCPARFPGCICSPMEKRVPMSSCPARFPGCICSPMEKRVPMDSCPARFPGCICSPMEKRVPTEEPLVVGSRTRRV
jgi:hypothetical protein